MEGVMGEEGGVRTGKLGWPLGLTAEAEEGPEEEAALCLVLLCLQLAVELVLKGGKQRLLLQALLLALSRRHAERGAWAAAGGGVRCVLCPDA